MPRITCTSALVAAPVPCLQLLPPYTGEAGARGSALTTGHLQGISEPAELSLALGKEQKPLRTDPSMYELLSSAEWLEKFTCPQQCSSL